MTRLHPQDLRAIMAASMSGPDRTVEPSLAVMWADELLDELERTAKPEPKADTLACGHGSWSIQPDGAMACLLCGTEWVMKATRTCSEVDETTPEQVEAQLLPHLPLTRRAMKAEGAREERERIIAVILHSEPGTPWGTFGSHQLRAALEPKP